MIKAYFFAPVFLLTLVESAFSEEPLKEPVPVFAGMLAPNPEPTLRLARLIHEGRVLRLASMA
jgi:hypothetical protein